MADDEVNRSAKSGEFVSDEEAKANPDTTVTEKNTVKKAKKPKVTTEEVDPEDPERLEREAEIDAAVANRTSRMDQDLKERARVVGINPDNFEKEHVLGEAVKKAEEELEANNVKENENGNE